MVTTPLYAGLLALWLLVLSLRVSQLRRVAGVSLSDGGNTPLLRAIRGHGNFAEYVPFALLLLALLELNDTSPYVLHGLGAALLAGRLLHGYALCFTPRFFFGRFWGIGLTWTVLAIEGVLCIYQALTWTGD
jgi:uncharacterized protein